jgi:hypothetical protein
VARRRHGKELGQPLDNAEDDRAQDIRHDRAKAVRTSSANRPFLRTKQTGTGGCASGRAALLLVGRTA